MENTVDRFVRKHNLIPFGATLVVGVSGGPDSMALLYYLIQRRPLWKIRIIACCVDHQLRGEESYADLLYVKDFCDQHKIEFIGQQVDVKAIKKERKCSTQVAARIARYDVFKDVMNNYHADCLVLAHHGDDQIETMLMRQVRGSFGTAKAGMPVRREFACGELIRPCLTVTKSDTENYCAQVGIKARLDPSNDSEVYMRNRFRKHVLPFLKRENPLVHLRFQEDSEKLRDDFLYLDELAKVKFNELIAYESDRRVSFSIQRLMSVPIPLQRRIIHLILNYLYSQESIKVDYNSVHIEDVLYWLKEPKSSGELHLPSGLRVERSYDSCRFLMENREARTSHINERVKVIIPGITPTPLGGLLSEVVYTYPMESLEPNECLCDLDLIDGPLYFRHRKPGDRIQPLGMDGTKKVKDLFIDYKIDKTDRDRWPLLVDERDQIVWIPYLRRGEAYKISPSSKTYLKLTLEAAALGRTL